MFTRSRGAPGCRGSRNTRSCWWSPPSRGVDAFVSRNDHRQLRSDRNKSPQCRRRTPGRPLQWHRVPWRLPWAPFFPSSERPIAKLAAACRDGTRGGRELLVPGYHRVASCEPTRLADASCAIVGRCGGSRTGTASTYSRRTDARRPMTVMDDGPRLQL